MKSPLRKTCAGIPNMAGEYSTTITFAGAAINRFDGQMDELAYYPYALTADAVKHHYGDMTTYGYDGLYRLTSVQYPNASSDSFTYDAVGNRLTKNSTTYSYDAADQMTVAGGVSYGYDANGNLTSRGSDTFTYDHQNRMTQAALAGGTYNYTYNGDGLRRTRSSSGSTHTYVWDVNSGLPQVLQDDITGSGPDTFIYVHGNDLVSRIVNDGTKFVFSYDALGSVKGLTNGTSGASAGAYDYDAFGNLTLDQSEPPNDFRFTGEQRDTETGFYYLRARYYDPATGRFISQDPFTGIARLPLTLNRYPYVINNPVNAVDPAGLCLRGLIKGSCGSAAKRVGKAIANDFWENVGPPYDLKKALQVIDLIPFSLVCGAGGAVVGGVAGGFAGGVGAIPGAYAGAGFGFALCEGIELVASVPSLYAGVTQALDSDCGWARKAAAIGINMANFAADFSLFLDYAIEYPLYRASNALTSCKPKE